MDYNFNEQLKKIEDKVCPLIYKTLNDIVDTFDNHKDIPSMLLTPLKSLIDYISSDDVNMKKCNPCEQCSLIIDKEKEMGGKIYNKITSNKNFNIQEIMQNSSLN